MTSKKSPIHLLSLAVPLAGSLHAATITSIAGTEWDVATTWSSGAAAPVTGTQGSGDDYVIASSFTVISNDSASNTQALIGQSLTIQSGGVLDLARLHASQTQTITWNLPPVTIQSGGELQFRGSTGSNTHTLAANIAVSGNTTIDNTGGGYAQNVELSGTFSGSGTVSTKTANSGNSTTTRVLALKSANSPFTGNWTVQHVNSGDDFGALRADAANALGTGVVTLDTRAQLINNAANGLDSLSGITLQQTTSTATLGSGWTNPAGVLTMNAGNLTLGSATSFGTASVASVAHNAGTLQFDLGSTPANSDRLVLSGNYATVSAPIDFYLKSDPGANTYDLVTYGGTRTGTPSVLLAASTPTRLTPNVNLGSGTNDKISVTFTGTVGNLVWKGNDGTNPNNWDLNTTTNFDNGGTAAKFLIADVVTFDDTAASFTPNQLGTLAARSVTFNNSSNAYSVAGAGSITGSATLTKDGTSSVTLANTSANTYSGATTVNAGKLVISTAQNTTGPITINGGKLVTGNAGSLGATGNKTITVNAGQLDFNGISPGTSRTYTYKVAGNGNDGTGALINSSATSVGGNSGIMNLELLGNTTLGGTGRFDVARIGSTSGTITGNGFTLTKSGANQIQLRGDASNMPIIVNEGVLGLEDSDLALGGASGNVTVNSGAVLGAYGARTIATPVRLNGGSTLRALGGAAATWSGAFTLGGHATIDLVSQSKIISGPIAETGGSFSLKKLNGNTLTLSGSNSFSGGLVIDNGIVLATTDTALGTGTVTIGDTTTGGTTHQLQLRGVTVANNLVSKYMYTGDYRGSVTAVGGLVSTVTGDVTIQPSLTGGTARGGHIAGDGTAGSVLRLMGELNVAGGQSYVTHRDGTVEYGGGSSTSYQLQVTNTARLAANNGIGAGVTIQLGTSGNSTLDLNGFSTTIAGLTRNASTTTVTNTAAGASVLTIDGSASTSYSGGIADGTGTVGLTKKGSGTFTLTETTSYSGNTSVEGGKLVINKANGSSPITVAAAGTLGGLGPINGSVAVAGTVAPGNSVGLLYTNSSVTFGPGSTYAWEIGDWNGTTAGTGWDLIDAMDLAFTATPANKLKIAISGTPTGFSETAKTFEIARSSTPITGFNASAIQIDTTGFFGTGTWSVQLNGTTNSIELVYAAGSGNPFNTWSASYGLPPNSSIDSDGDGIPNGIEFVIGGKPNAGTGSDSSALLPTITSDAQYLYFTYRRTDEAAGMPPAQQPYVQYGVDLNGWDTAVAGEDGVTISEVNGTPDLVTVKIPRSLAGNGKLFTRLRVDLE